MDSNGSHLLSGRNGPVAKDRDLVLAYNFFLDLLQPHWVSRPKWEIWGRSAIIILQLWKNRIRKSPIYEWGFSSDATSTSCLLRFPRWSGSHPKRAKIAKRGISIAFTGEAVYLNGANRKSGKFSSQYPAFRLILKTQDSDSLNSWNGTRNPANRISTRDPKIKIDLRTSRPICANELWKGTIDNPGPTHRPPCKNVKS